MIVMQHISTNLLRLQLPVDLRADLVLVVVVMVIYELMILTSQMFVQLVLAGELLVARRAWPLRLLLGTDVPLGNCRGV